MLEAEGVEPLRPLAYAARIFLPLVQASSDAPFGHETGGAFTLAKTWLGRDETAQAAATGAGPALSGRSTAPPCRPISRPGRG